MLCYRDAASMTQALGLLVSLLLFRVGGAPREGRSSVWQNFNQRLTIAADVRFQAALQGMRQPGMSLNADLARDISTDLLERFSSFDMRFSVAVWNHKMPQTYKLYMQEEVGASFYQDCIIMPRERNGIDHAPCGEGGAVYKGMGPFRSLFRRNLMVFYSPVAYGQPTASGHLPPPDGLLRSYLIAVELCIQAYWGPPLSLLGLATCIDRQIRLRLPPGFSGVRGVVVAPDPVQSDLVEAPSFCSAEGHVFRNPQKAMRYDTNEVLIGGVPFEHKELMIFMGVPLFIPAVEP